MKQGLSFTRVLSAIFLLASAGSALAQSTGATFGDIISLGGTPSDAVLDELRGRIYLVNDKANRVDVYSIGEKRIVSNIIAGARPLAAAISMDSAFLYVANNSSSTLSVIDLSSNTVVQTVPLPARPEGVEVGADGRVLISTVGTGVNNASNTLLIFDRNQQQAAQLLPVQVPPPPSTPAQIGSVTLPRPVTQFSSKLQRTPDGQFIVGLYTPANASFVFVYEVASGVILRSRTTSGQSSVLSMSPDGSRFMAGFTMFDTATLAVIAQQNVGNAPFTVSSAFTVNQNVGGSIFSPDGKSLYSAFNVAAFANPQPRPQSSTLLVNDPTNLGIQLGIKMPESIVAKMLVSSDGTQAWGLSESGMISLPLGKLYEYPILQPETTTVFLTMDPCNRGLARGTLRINNLGKGKLTFSVPNLGQTLVAQVSSGVAPATITFTMEPGRSGVVRQPGTNLWTNAGTFTGTAFNVNLASLEAINIPNTIRVFMNFRDNEQRGMIFPVPTGPNNNQNVGAPTTTTGDQGLLDVVLDEPRGFVYITNAAYNRIERFDIRRQRFTDPITVNQLPRQMAMGTDGNTLYVGSSGGEVISIVDLDQRRVVGQVDFPPIPRVGTTNIIYPRTLAMGLSGLQFVMSNGSQWKVVGNQATVRPADSITLTTQGTNILPGGPNYSMISSPDSSYILTLAGNGLAYLFDARIDAYTAGRLLFGTPGNLPIQSYFGALGAGPGGAYFVANGLIMNSSLSVIGGAERPGATQVTQGQFPFQPPQQTVVSAGQRNVASIVPLSDTAYLRLTTPVRAQITTATRDDIRPILEVYDVRVGGESIAGVAAEGPVNNIFGNSRINIPPRQLVVDSRGTAYAITVSGLSVMPLAPASAATRPAISTGARGIVNSTDGTPNLRPGSFVSVTGANLAASATADTLPTPTVLGGTCVTFNDVAIPLLQAGPGQISGQVPDSLRPGQYVVQVRSLATAQFSDPVLVTVRPSGSAGNAPDPGAAPLAPAPVPPVPASDPEPAVPNAPPPPAPTPDAPPSDNAGGDPAPPR